MKTYLVTGGYGFIGSAFVLARLAEGGRVINLDKLTYAANRENLAEAEEQDGYEFVEGDIADMGLVAKIFSDNQIDYVVNFAAESHVDNSINAPDVFLQTNIMGVFNLLQHARQYWDENGRDENFRFLHVSTDEVYGALPKDGSKFTESSQYQPNSPYSASKAASDHLVRAWHHTYGLPVITTNCSNNFGPRQHKEKLIPKVITNALSGEPIPIYGKGENVRDWIFVEDHANGVQLALTKGEIGETYCFGGNMELTNNELVNMICEILDELQPRGQGGSYKELITYVTDRAGHDLRYAIDDNKAVKELGFTRNGEFRDRLADTIKWYMAS